MKATEILTGLSKKVDLVGFSHLKPTTKENLYIIMALLVFTTVLTITLMIERRLDEKRRQERRRRNYLFVDEEIDNEVSENKNRTASTMNNNRLDMQSLDNVM